MAHGWKETDRNETDRKSCKCGQGYIIEIEIEEESDMSFYPRRRRENEYTCPDRCHLK